MIDALIFILFLISFVFYLIVYCFIDYLRAPDAPRCSPMRPDVPRCAPRLAADAALIYILFSFYLYLFYFSQFPLVIYALISILLSFRFVFIIQLLLLIDARSFRFIFNLCIYFSSHFLVLLVFFYLYVTAIVFLFVSYFIRILFYLCYFIYFHLYFYFYFNLM